MNDAIAAQAVTHTSDTAHSWATTRCPVCATLLRDVGYSRARLVWDFVPQRVNPDGAVDHVPDARAARGVGEEEHDDGAWGVRYRCGACGQEVADDAIVSFLEGHYT